MSWLTKTLTSSIGKKVLMALTGLFLCTFLIIHLIGNLQLLKDDGGYAFNTYAVFMTSNPLIKTTSYLLYASILFHAFWGLYITWQNKKARPVGYAKVNQSSTLASRNMAVLGTIVLVYIAVHMADFWAEYKFGHMPYVSYTENLNSGAIESTPMEAGYVQESKMVESYDQSNLSKTTIVKDLYTEVAEAFKNPLISIFYVLAMIAMGYHLAHGFQSGFQTLGINHPKYSPFIKNVGIWIFAILIPAGFAVLPLYFLIK
ncbi:succinate dehydrogenase / fumarate reductase cytochrome b subunit [Spirosomataceae bacterium TFI 002]|nr:succinate dehydrogenase / fumarate reductase cytochrome b subunit [Spirosomataceae bacterium TFI 002]